jgi:predicted dithiol-disulfide oxidoreductase (DUF899 family)
MADTPHKVVSHDEWLAARKALLVKEKEFMKAQDQLSEQRRALPWERVAKPYVFDGLAGQETLSDLFAGSSQLAVYHFMFAPEWEEGCKHCSFWADNFNGTAVHLKHRDVSFVAISRAPLAKLEQFRKRMGWSFKWVSSGSGDFNYDYRVSFTPEEVAKGEYNHNYRISKNTLTDPYLLRVCARRETDQRRLSFPRSDAEWARRSGSRLRAGLGAASRSLRGLNGAYIRDEPGLRSPTGACDRLAAALMYLTVTGDRSSRPTWTSIIAKLLL